MVIVLVTGVCGSGKTTIGRYIGKQLSWPFVDADDFHPASNIEKMKNGIPLTDKDRLPWLIALNEVVKRWKSRCESGVLACSALKTSYRKIILQGTSGKSTSETPPQYPRDNKGSKDVGDFLIVLLQGSKDLIRERILNRKEHFMPDSLLDSQLEVLEEPESSDYTLKVGIERSVEETANEILTCLKALFDVNVTVHSTV
ncbi:predicted protein [Nematostella vectensis]|uniref:Probable gluconokinase n=1 Tax=Nematostella vectensis TaxID=45351 RepID=A7SPH5_NEMVE|nr:probable gluconokinase [Nematostella vectensis]EDO34410.1 predicted protein [Nematostella vectensis]|eukprot:XP_001626510.1 predicted protein [Nematostella vectensis]